MLIQTNLRSRHLARPTVARRPALSLAATRAAPRRTVHESRDIYRQIQARSYSIEGKIPEGVQFEVKPEAEGSDIEWNEDTKTLRIPLSAVEGSGTAGRRTKLVIFTCNKCGGRTARNVNPVAWEKGMVMGQCAHCEVWHVLSAKNKAIFEEIRYTKDGTAVNTFDGSIVSTPTADGASSSGSGLEEQSDSESAGSSSRQ